MRGKPRILGRWKLLLASFVAACTHPFAGRSRMRGWLAFGGIGLLGLAAFFLVTPATVWYQLRQARRALADRRIEQALGWLESAEARDPECGAALFLLARAHRRLNHAEKTRAYLVRAMRAGYPVERLKREESMAMVQAGQLAVTDPRVWDLMRDPGDDALDIYEALIRGYVGTYHIEPAQRLLDAWEADYPADPQSHFYRGIVFTHQTQWEEAAAAFAKALKRAPERTDIRGHLAEALREQFRYREAMQHYRICLETGEVTADPEWRFGLGKCLEALAQTEEARQAYLELLGDEPDHYGAALALGKLEYAFGEAQEALPWLEVASRKRPYDFQARHALAWALLVTGQKEQARRHFQCAAESQAAEGRVKNLMHHLTARPEDTEFRYQIGITLAEYGKPSVAQLWLTSVLRLEPDHSRAHRALSEHYEKQGDFAQAAEHRRLAESRGKGPTKEH